MDFNIEKDISNAVSVWLNKEMIQEVKVINHGEKLISHDDEGFEDVLFDIFESSESGIFEIEANDYSLRITTKDHRVYVIYFKTKTNEN